MKVIRDIIQGAGYLEGYGDHPGTPMLIIFILMGGIAGIEKGGLFGFIAGSLVMALIMGTFWVVGCVDRARDYQRDNKN